MKGVILAGGKGRRLRPLTCNTPKPMLPLLEKPVLEYNIELLRQHGIREIAITVQYMSTAIKQYFGDGSKWGVNLYYFEDSPPLGTAGSIKQAEKFLDEPFVVISGDALTDFQLSEGITFHEQKNGNYVCKGSRKSTLIWFSCNEQRTRGYTIHRKTELE